MRAAISRLGAELQSDARRRSAAEGFCFSPITHPGQHPDPFHISSKKRTMTKLLKTKRESERCRVGQAGTPVILGIIFL